MVRHPGPATGTEHLVLTSDSFVGNSSVECLQALVAALHHTASSLIWLQGNAAAALAGAPRGMLPLPEHAFSASALQEWAHRGLRMLGAADLHLTTVRKDLALHGDSHVVVEDLASNKVYLKVTSAPQAEMLASSSLLLDGKPSDLKPGKYSLQLPQQAADAPGMYLAFSVTLMAAIRATRSSTYKTWLDLRPALAFTRNRNLNVTRKGLANNAPWPLDPFKASARELLVIARQIRLGLEDRSSHSRLELPTFLETYQEASTGLLVIQWPDVINWARLEYRLGFDRAAVQLPIGPCLASVDVVTQSTELRARMVAAAGTIRQLHQRQFSHVQWNPAPLRLPAGHPDGPDGGSKASQPARQRRGRSRPPTGNRTARPGAIRKGWASLGPPAFTSASMAGKFMNDYD